MKKIIKIIISILSIKLFIIILYFMWCYGFYRVKEIDDRTLLYKKDEYIISDYDSLVIDRNNGTLISRYIVWYCPLMSEAFWARTKKNPDVIISNRGRMAFRKGIDYNNIPLEATLTDKKTSKDYHLSNITINDIVSKEIKEESNNFLQDNSTEVCTYEFWGTIIDDLCYAVINVSIYQLENDIICKINGKLYQGTNYLVNLIEQLD